MLRVIIEDWPYGREQDKTVLGHMDIINDGTGTLAVGNYYVRLGGDGHDFAGRGGDEYYSGSHKRELGWWPLVVQAFKWAGEAIPRGK